MKVPEKLETKRVIIRRFIPQDLDALFSFLSDKEATQFLTFAPEQKTFKGAKKLLDHTIDSYESSNPIFALAVTKKEDGRYIGAVGISPIKGGQDFEVFYTLLPRFWGRGFATEAVKSILKYAFYELNLERIYSYMAPGNIASENVVKRLGMNYMRVVDRQGRKVKLYSIKKTQFLTYFD